MNVITIIQLVLTLLALTLLLSFRYKPSISRFEMKRLSGSEKGYKDQLRFLEIYPGIRLIILVLALIDAISICAITLFAWGFLGAVLAFALIILAFFLSRSLSKIVKDLIEKNFVWFNKYFAWAEMLGKIVIAGEESKIHSKHELAHLIETGDFMEMTDKMLLLGSLEFIEKKVSDVMIKKTDIDSVKSSDVVGPKLLDELHQTGHLVFPVTKGKDIIGMLHVEDVIVLEQGEKSVTEAMRRVPTVINKNATLQDALQEMKNDHSCQLLVTNDDERLVGLIDISDIVSVLFGRKL